MASGGKAAEAKPEAAPEAAVEEGAAKAEDADGAGAAPGDEGDEDFGIIGETPKITVDEFFRRAKEKARVPDCGETHEEQMHWTHPRRWKVRIWAVRIENAIKDNEMYAFANFIFGGNREEFQVRPERGDPVIWIAGEEGLEVRTPVVRDIPGDGIAEELDFDESFDWHGSYMDLENQCLRIELWNWARYRVNKFDSYYQDVLLNFAKGNIQNEVECIKLNSRGKRLVRARISFKLYFQEIYDFQLTFISWRATGLLNCAQTLDLLARGDDVAESRGRTSRSSVASLVNSAPDDPGTGQRIQLVTPWLRSWCSCWSGRSFLSPSAAITNGCTDWREWDSRSVHFRGTCSELNHMSVEATIFSAENYRELGLPRAPRGTRRSGIPLCTATVPLKGILEHGETQAELVPASWFYEAEGGHRAKKHDSGTLQGHVIVEQQPRYQQKEDPAGDLDFQKRYLFVHVIKVDRVVTPDTRPTTDIDTYVEVSFDGKCQKTRVKQDTSAPHFDDVLVFEITLARTAAASEAAGSKQEYDEAHVCEEIENKGPVHFDLWTSGPVSNDHLGSCEAFLSEILVDERGQGQKVHKKAAKDRQKKAEEEFDVRVLRGQKQLSFIWGEGGSSNMFFDMWFLPDLGKNARLKKVRPQRRAKAMPKAMEDRFLHLQERWEQKTTSLCYEGREFPCMMPNQWEVGAEQVEGCFLPRFVDVLKPPRGIETCNAICHFVGCFPWMPKNSPSRIAFTPDFFGRIRKGEALDHALLHAGLLLGAGRLAFVCLGTNLKRQPHAWAATLEADGTVIFWEPYLGSGSRALRRRLAHPELLSGGRLPGGLPQEAVQAEVDRRKRLSLQRAATRGSSSQLELRADSAHEHPMVYVDISTGLHADAICGSCKAYGCSKGFKRGFVCQEGDCHYALCWQCAEPHWGDRAALDSLSFDPTEPYVFDDSVESSGGLRQKMDLPYRSLEVVFNNTNCWANMQHRDPRKILWDLWNPSYWHPFTPKVASIHPCFLGCRFAEGDRDEAWCAFQRRQVLRQVQTTLRGRRSVRNLDTRWVRAASLSTFLEAGLKLRAKLDVCEDNEMEALRKELQDWGHALEAKTPRRHCFRGAPLHFGFCDPVLVAREAVELCGLADAREKTTQFAVAVHLTPLPGEVVSLYIFICSLHRLTDLEVTEEIWHRENQRKPGGAQFMNLLQKAKADLSGHTGIALHDMNTQASQTAAPAEAPGKAQPTSPTPHVDDALAKAAAADPVTRGADARSQAAATEGRPQLQPGGSDTQPQRPEAASHAEDLDVGSDEEVLPPPGSVQPPSVLRATARRASVLDAPASQTNLPRASIPRASMKGGCLPQEALPMPMQFNDESEDYTEPLTDANPHDTGQSWMSSLWNVVSGSPVPVMSAFSQTVKGHLVDLSADGLTAMHRGESGAELSGGLLGNGPMQRFSAGWYFEVRVDIVRDRVGEGLALGVTTLKPAEVSQVPDAMEELGPCWMLSAEGSQFDGSSWGPCSWRPGPVRRGDRVGVLVTREGELRAVLNGSVAAAGDFLVPCDGPLFAVIDLVGATAGVTFCPGAQPSAQATAEQKENKDGGRHLNAGAAANAPTESQPLQGGFAEANPVIHEMPIMRCFSHCQLGSQVTLSADGLVASLQEGAGEDGPCGGLVFGDGRLPPLPGGVGFALTVVAVRLGGQQGLAVGVTTRLPNAAEGPLASAEKVSPSWFAGYDGAAWNGSKKEWLLSDWFPGALKVGDTVETQVTTAGELHISVNAQKRAVHALGIPSDVPLFALVELHGRTSGVRLRLPTAGGDRGGSSPAAKPRAPAATESVPEESEMRGFHRMRVGARISLSGDGRAATRARGSDGDAHCVIMGDGPLKVESDGGVAFALTVTAARGGAAAGPAVGVTTQRPRDIVQLPDTADQVRPSWLLGYDGASWDGASAAWGLSPWSPGGLAAGDLLELRASAQGKLQIFVNRVEQAVHTMRIPVSEQLFALVDLQGGTTGVSFVPPGELPPPGRPGTATGVSAPAAPMRGFSRTALGRSLLLSPDGQTATRVGGVSPGSDCVLVGDGPLEACADGGVSFTVSITIVSECTEGLALGVTSSSPAELGPPPASADRVKPCWLAGFDGATWDGTANEWGFSTWDPSELKVGDTALVRVTALGELCISVNGVLRTTHGMRIPVDKPLFALADLGGSVSGMALVLTRKAQKKAGNAPSTATLKLPAPKASPGRAAGPPAGNPRRRVSTPGGVQRSLTRPLPPRPVEGAPASPRTGHSPRPAGCSPRATKAAKKKDDDKERKPRDADEKREKKEKKEHKEPKTPKGATEAVDAKELKASKEAKEAKELKTSKDAKEVKELKAAKEAKGVKELKTTKEVKEVKELKAAKEAKEVKELKATKAAKEVKDLKVPKDATEKKEKKKKVKEEGDRSGGKKSLARS